jgi:hypothetical protein
MECQGGKTLHPLIQGILSEVTRFENIPDKREPHTLPMQHWLRARATAVRDDELDSALADWGALGLVLGPRLSEWAQEDGGGDPFQLKRAPNGRTWALTWDDLDARLTGNRRVLLSSTLMSEIRKEKKGLINLTRGWGARDANKEVKNQEFRIKR